METPHERLAAELRTRVDRLLNTTEAKFQYIRDLQGDPIADLENTRILTLVVNAHGPVLGQLVRTVSALGYVTAELLTTQEKLVDAVAVLQERVVALEGSAGSFRRELDGVADELTDLINEVDNRTLIVPDAPEGIDGM